MNVNQLSSGHVVYKQNSFDVSTVDLPIIKYPVNLFTTPLFLTWVDASHRRENRRHPIPAWITGYSTVNASEGDWCCGASLVY